MREKTTVKNSQPRGEKGGFYFVPILITLKKFFPVPHSLSDFCRGQAALEYFIIFFVILVATLLSTSIFYPQVHSVIEDFFKKTTQGIVEQPCTGSFVLDGGTGITFCRMSADCNSLENCCPEGWVHYENWSTTKDSTCKEFDEYGVPSFNHTGYHDWANLPQECIPECHGHENYCAQVIEIGCVPAEGSGG